MRLLHRSQFTSSLDALVRSHTSGGASEDTELGVFVKDASAKDPEEEALKGLEARHVRKLVDTLPPRQAEVIRRRYGFDTGVAETLGEIGQSLGVSRERIRQLEVQAFRTLKSRAKTRL